MNSYFLGGLLFDCEFPECMAGRERLASCWQWKGQAQSQPAQGQGRKKASFPYILRVGRIFMFPASMFVCVDTFLYVRAVCMVLYFKVCTVLPQEFNSSLKEWSIAILLETTSTQLCFLVQACFVSRFRVYLFRIPHCIFLSLSWIFGETKTKYSSLKMSHLTPISIQAKTQ